MQVFNPKGRNRRYVLMPLIVDHAPDSRLDSHDRTEYQFCGPRMEPC